MIINEFLVAFLRMDAVSSISAMNVDTPLSCESPAPIRARIASQSGISAVSQGTKQPTWARRIIMPIWRMYVDLPPMLAPVMIWNSDWPRRISTSLAIKVTSGCTSRQAWRALLSTRSPVPIACSVGRTNGVGAWTDTTAKLCYFFCLENALKNPSRNT